MYQRHFRLVRQDTNRFKVKTPTVQPAASVNFAQPLNGEKSMNKKQRIPLAQTFMLDILVDPKARPILFYIAINLLIGAAIFHWLEGWGWLDSVYFVVITLTTIGYGDLSPTTPVTKIFTIFYSINGVVMLLVLFDLVRSVRGWHQKPKDSSEEEVDPKINR